MSSARTPILRGRGAEEGTLRRLLDDARAGRGGALLLAGAAGMGKTALLDLAAAYATDSASCGLRRGRRVAPAVRRSARPAPADEASRELLSFAARRLAGERVVLLFTARDDDWAPAGVPVRVLRGLGEAARRELLGDLVPDGLAEDLRAAIEQIARGNPLATAATGLRLAQEAGQRNTAAQHLAWLALTTSASRAPSATGPWPIPICPPVAPRTPPTGCAARSGATTTSSSG